MTSLNQNECLLSHGEHNYACLVTLNTPPQQWNSRIRKGDSKKDRFYSEICCNSLHAWSKRAASIQTSSRCSYPAKFTQGLYQVCASRMVTMLPSPWVYFVPKPTLNTSDLLDEGTRGPVYLLFCFEAIAVRKATAVGGGTTWLSLQI